MISQVYVNKLFAVFSLENIYFVIAQFAYRTAIFYAY